MTFHDPMHGKDVLERYTSADTCLVSLRDDWKSFETTVPSKTYEVLAVGRHVTAVVRGIVASSPEALAALWTSLAKDRGRLIRNGDGRQWVKEHADYPYLAARYMELIEDVLVTSGSRRR